MSRDSSKLYRKLCKKEIMLLINIHVTGSGLVLKIDEQWSRYN